MPHGEEGTFHSRVGSSQHQGCLLVVALIARVCTRRSDICRGKIGCRLLCSCFDIRATQHILHSVIAEILVDGKFLGYDLDHEELSFSKVDPCHAGLWFYDGCHSTMQALRFQRAQGIPSDIPEAVGAGKLETFKKGKVKVYFYERVETGVLYIEPKVVNNWKGAFGAMVGQADPQMPP
jgi:hypothetical protein